MLSRMTYPPAPGNPPPVPTSSSASAPPPEASRGEESLQFDRADYGTAEAPPASACSACQQPITGTYYAAGEHVICPPCRDEILASMTGGSGAGRFSRAVLFGLGAGIAGALLWYAVTKLTGYEIGLIAIVIGFLVGTAVRKGSADRGGLAYQLLAVFITYCCIVSTYVPDIYSQAANEPGDAPTWFLLAFSIVIAFIAPVLMGFENIIGMLIIAFALWQAWQMTKYRPIEFTGPFTIAGSGAATAASAPPSSMPPPVSPAREEPPPTAPPPPPPHLGMT